VFGEGIVPQLKNIEAIEKRLWNAADTLRSSSNYASNEYFIPVMGLIFLQHAYSGFLAVREEITANLPTRRGKARPLTVTLTGPGESVPASAGESTVTREPEILNSQDLSDRQRQIVARIAEKGL
jgi:hypothetical protein